MKKILDEKGMMLKVMTTDWGDAFLAGDWTWYWITIYAKQLGKKGVKPRVIHTDIYRRIEQMRDRMDWFAQEVNVYKYYKYIDKLINAGYKYRKEDYISVTSFKIPKAVIKWIMELQINPEWEFKARRINCTINQLRNYMIWVAWQVYAQKQYKSIDSAYYCYWEIKQLKEWTGINYTALLMRGFLNFFSFNLSGYAKIKNNKDYEGWFLTNTEEEDTYSCGWITYHDWFSHSRNTLKHWRWWINAKNLFEKVIPDIDENDYYQIDDITPEYFQRFFKSMQEKYNNQKGYYCIDCGLFVKKKLQQKSGKYCCTCALKRKGIKKINYNIFICQRCGREVEFKSVKGHSAKFCDDCKKEIKSEQNRKYREEKAKARK